MKSFCLAGLVLLLLPLSALHGQGLRVGVSVLPLETVVREIGGAAVEVRSLQREGDSCSVFEPRPSSIAWLAKAELFFRTGAGYESVLMDKIHNQFQNIEIVDLREAVNAVPMTAHQHHDHHGAHCSACGGHEATDPHIWLDPLNLAAMADVIAARLAVLLPESADDFRVRAAAFKKRAMEMHNSLQGMLEPYAGSAFFIYHPALGYFAQRYQLNQVSIAGSGDSPTVRELHAKIRQARELSVSTVFVQPQESRRHAEILAGAIGAEVVEINPMATDWEENLLRIGKALTRAFTE